MGYQSVFRRYEKKYLVTQEQYDRLTKVFAPRMERDRFSESTISNIYYDTPDFRLIRRSLDQPVYKESCGCAPTAHRTRIRRPSSRSRRSTTMWSTSAASA